MSHIYRFHMRWLSSRGDSYYVDHWNEAVPVEVIAGTKEEAKHKALAMLGKPSDYRVWKCTIDRIEEIQQPPELT